MKKLALAFFVLGLTAPAQADVVMTGPVARSRPRIQLVSFSQVSSDAPGADSAGVRRDVRRALNRRSRRIERCVAELDLRRDPLRSGARTLEGRLVFSRSPRPRVVMGRDRGFPRAARACVERSLRGMRIETTPRGTVEVRFSYSIR